ncbi:MAG: hypothetical protein HQL81_12240 [Magnetococcales bacterium]|nr:hypothetical protein [Magnetococcales bacterium]
MLDELEEDAIKELFNLSLGRAVPTLSEMVDAEIEFSVPCLEMTPASSLVENIESLVGSAACLVQMGFDLVFSWRENLAGTALFLMRADSMEPMLNALYGVPVPMATQHQVCRETFTDVGDLVLYTCVSTLSRLLDSDVEGEKPAFHRGNPRDWNIAMASFNPGGEGGFDGHWEEKRVANLRIDVAIPVRKVAGSVLIWFDLTDGPDLKRAIRHFIATHTG